MSKGGDPVTWRLFHAKASSGMACRRWERLMSSKPGSISIKRKNKTPFDPKDFLAKITEGHTVSDYRKGEIVYTQGEPADSVFYMHKGKAKITVLSEQGKEAVVA